MQQVLRVRQHNKGSKEAYLNGEGNGAVDAAAPLTFRTSGTAVHGMSAKRSYVMGMRAQRVGCLPPRPGSMVTCIWK